jgi:hypothetical protein
MRGRGIADAVPIERSQFHTRALKTVRTESSGFGVYTFAGFAENCRAIRKHVLAVRRVIVNRKGK